MPGTKWSEVKARIEQRAKEAAAQGATLRVTVIAPKAGGKA